MIAFEGCHKEEFPEGEIRMNVNLVRLRLPSILKNELAIIKQAIDDAMYVYWMKLQNIPERKLLLTISFSEPTYY